MLQKKLLRCKGTSINFRKCTLARAVWKHLKIILLNDNVHDKCTVRFQTRTRKYIHRFLENVCHDCSGFREFYHTSQLFILLSSGQTSTHPSSCLFLSFGYVEMIK